MKQQYILMKIDVKKSIKLSGLAGLVLLTGLLTAGCDSQIYDSLDPCPTAHHLKFCYDYNMKEADAFAAEVGSVAVWAFDSSTGKLVWQHQESGEALASGDYQVDVPLPPGKYDFLSWCGLSSESPFKPDTEAPASLTDLGMTLGLSEKESRAVGSFSDALLPGLYHGLKRGVEITQNPDEERDVEILLSLTKDTNYFRILLQNLDGKELKEEDFSFRITRGNNRLEYDNRPGAGETFDYLPWSLMAAAATVPDGETAEGTITTVSGVLAELHTSRLMADGTNRLVITRNTDGKEIINIPLIDYLLLVKGHYRQMSNQEYLDRQDDYAMTFFLDADSNWYRAIGIYVNAWHLVPPQDTSLQ